MGTPRETAADDRHAQEMEGLHQAVSLELYRKNAEIAKLTTQVNKLQKQFHQKPPPDVVAHLSTELQETRNQLALSQERAEAAAKKGSEELEKTRTEIERLQQQARDQAQQMAEKQQSAQPSAAELEKDQTIEKLKQAMVRAREEIIRLRSLELEPSKATPFAASSPEDPGVIRQNMNKIRDVMQFWFGRSPPEEAQKHLWMIGPSQLRDEIDQEITELFQSLLIELEKGLWKDWSEDADALVYGVPGKIAAIVVFDQFSRHIHRYRQQHPDGPVIPSQDTCDMLAVQLANTLLQQHAAELRTGMVPLSMFVFALMPYRHTGEKSATEYVHQQCDGLDQLVDQLKDMCGRFRKATTRRLADYNDSERREGGDDVNEFTDEDILAHFAFPADKIGLDGHTVFKAVKAFLASRGIFAVPDGQELRFTPIVVSLSGGVDSMVIASVLADMVRNHRFALTLYAVHIDYANRSESAAEAAFVRRYAESEGFTVHVRRIDEVTRGVTARDEYEKVSRDIRYQLYREVVELSRKGSTEPGVIVGRVEVGVVLGHHRGDLRENVLSNAHKGSGPLDLSGMTHVSQNDGVTIYRPLLPLEKDAVFEYAHAFGVPYFKDTTPHWSTRGKLRNQLLPLLQEIYGEGSMGNLSSLAVESDECRALLHDSTLGPFLEQVEHYPMGISFDTEEWLEQGLYFWKYVLREALHSAQLGMFTDKAVKSFVERVKAENIHEGWIQARKDYGVYLREDGRIYVLQPSSFPFRKSDLYNVNGQQLFYGHENSTTVGPWRITALMLGKLNDILGDEEIEERLSRKAVGSMDLFMEGKIDYYVEVPTWQSNDGTFEARPLVFTNFTKANRPKAWKSTDVRLQETLPLLGNDDMALQALKDPHGWGTTHMDENGADVPNPVLLVHVTLQINDGSMTEDMNASISSESMNITRRSSVDSRRNSMDSTSSHRPSFARRGSLTRAASVGASSGDSSAIRGGIKRAVSVGASSGDSSAIPRRSSRRTRASRRSSVSSNKKTIRRSSLTR